MKNLVFIFLLLALRVHAGDNEQRIEAPITAVTIYLSGAEITHSKTISLMPGRNELKFVGLTSKLIPKSIQFNAVGDVSILAISNRIDYIFGQKKNDVRINQLNDSLELMTDAQSIVAGMIDAYEREKQMLDANRSIGGNDKGVTNAELKLNADFFLARMTEINSELVKLRRKQARQLEIITRLNYQVSEANQRTNPPMGEITVLVNVGGAVKIESAINLRYVASDAGWAPSYDLIAEDIDKPIDLKYRAKVFNNTDVDWKDIKMKLSTSDPMKSAEAPTLDKWTLNFDNDYNTYAAQQQQYYNNNNNGNQNAPAALESQNLVNSTPAQARKPASAAYGGNAGYVYDAEQEVQQVVQYEQIQISELSAEFDIKQRYDIPADGKPYIVDVTSYNLNATFQYNCVPKVDRDAFMMARITGWEDLDLVEGPANVYFGGTYVGQSYIYTRSTDDTLDLSFGRDNKMLVTRTKLKEINNDKTPGSTKKETFSYEIVVKNTRKGMVQVKLQDQVPVSQDAEITVETPELSKGVLDPATGIITWNLNVPPGETVKVKLTYVIKYPKNKVVRTKKYKTAARAKF